MILSIDPGTTQTAYCFCDYDTIKPISFGKVDNDVIMSDVLPQINDYAIISIHAPARGATATLNVLQ